MSATEEDEEAPLQGQYSSPDEAEAKPLVDVESPINTGSEYEDVSLVTSDRCVNGFACFGFVSFTSRLMPMGISSRLTCLWMHRCVC